MNIQDKFPLGWTGLVFLLSKELSRVFSLLYPHPKKRNTDHKYKKRLGHILNPTFSTFFFVNLGHGNSLCLLASDFLFFWYIRQ